jgi:exoribonuclease R
MNYRFICNDRNYENIKIYDDISMQEVEITTSYKLFNHDVFQIDESGANVITHSCVRSSTMSGILILKNNKTYGKIKSKLLYRCIPDDKRLPIFLVPFNLNTKHFSKEYINKYVIFKFANWDNKHPIGMLTQVIGNIDVENNYYEYVLHCKCLNTSMTYFNRSMHQRLKTKSADHYFDTILKTTSLQDRRSINVYTIDSSKTLDYDDAFSIVNYDDYIVLSIYIANVSIWLDVLNLWEAFSRRVSTIYLPDKKHPMLPVILSENLCSLKQGIDKIALAMDIKIKDDIIDISYHNTIINVNRNMVYQSDELLENKDYQYAFEITNVLNQKKKLITKISTSIEFVTYLMLMFNKHSGSVMIKHHNGIYRGTKNNIVSYTSPTTSEVPNELSEFLNIWKGMSGEYTSYENVKPHLILKFDNYIHITSPIRRLVDLLNITILQHNLNLVNLTTNALLFYQNWIKELDYINTTTRSIRKIQYDCSLLHMCLQDDTIIEKIYKGYIFDKLMRDDALYKYMVYLPEIKMVSPITLRNEIDNYDTKNFKLFVVTGEDNIKKKIRIQLLD